jgi:hypothetical protein
MTVPSQNNADVAWLEQVAGINTPQANILFRVEGDARGNGYTQTPADVDFADIGIDYAEHDFRTQAMVRESPVDDAASAEAFVVRYQGVFSERLQRKSFRSQ